MLTCYIKGKNLINGSPEHFNIADGAVFIDNYNETLDSGTIVLPQLTSKIDIEPYDVIRILDGDGDTFKDLCVDRYICTQECLDPAIYKYEIHLFSETKQLEGILCPSLAITKSANINRTVMTYLERYLNLYGTKLNSNDMYGAYENKFSLGTSLNRFNNIECPEMQWNEPTLREIFTDLMMVDDCIPVVRNNVIECIDISSIGSEISNAQKNKINYITESQSSEDYVSEIKMNLQNGTNGEASNGLSIPNNCTRIVERIGFRNDETYLLDTNRIILQTAFPIWKVFGFRAYIYAKATYHFKRNATYQGTEDRDATITVEVNLFDYLLEYNKWLTKDVLYGAWGSSTELSATYRNTCLYYKRGSKNIENFNNKYQTQFLWITDNQYVTELIIAKGHQGTTYKALLEAKARQTCEEMGWLFQTIDNPEEINYKNITFELEYEPIDECVFIASKSPFQTNKRTVVDNQTNSYINTERQGFLEYLKANRLGNKVIVANGRYDYDNDTVPALAQKINDKIIFKRELAYYENHIKANFYATENYVLRDYYTGIKSKLRSWRIISGSEALLRKECVKFYVNQNIPSISNFHMIIPSYQTLDEYLSNFKYCLVQFDTNDGFKPSDTSAIALEISKHKVGNSVVFTMRLNDNFYAGNYISQMTVGSSRTEQKGIGYTDSNGEVLEARFRFYNAKNYENVTPVSNLPTTAQKFPVMSFSDTSSGTVYHFVERDLVASIPVQLWKDNKEILQISIQFELNEEANDMFLGKK